MKVCSSVVIVVNDSFIHETRFQHFIVVSTVLPYLVDSTIGV